MAHLASFWTGGGLGPIETASLRSFLRYGETVTVFAPGPVADLPEGVMWRDANTILPAKRILTDRRSGSPAPHADLFRYALLERTDMIWVDLDVIALRPFDGEAPWIFGYEDDATVNNAVLRLPRDSETLRLLRQFRPDTRGIPPFFSGVRRLRYQLRSLGQGIPIERWPWGSTGPRALTHFLRLTGEIRHARPVSAFYAVPQREAARFLAPDSLRASDLPEDAWAVHLWAKDLRRDLARNHRGRVPDRSFLGRALRDQL